MRHVKGSVEDIPQNNSVLLDGEALVFICPVNLHWLCEQPRVTGSRMLAASGGGRMQVPS